MAKKEKIKLVDCFTCEEATKNNLEFCSLKGKNTKWYSLKNKIDCPWHRS